MSEESVQDQAPKQDGGAGKRIALAAVVTKGVLEEFEILKLSFELFHGIGFQWYVRCCESSAQALSHHTNVRCAVFPATHNARFNTDNPSFNGVVVHKMNAIGDAWDAGDWDAVAFLDSDLIFTAPFLHELALIEGQVLLTPHYWPKERIADVDKYGFFNSGFVFTRTPGFHIWWREAFLSQPHKFTDQQCLDDAPSYFHVALVREEANIGFWRSENGTTKLTSFQIPNDCKFLHVHLFQPSKTPDEIVSRIFAEQYFAFTTGRDVSIQPFNWYQLQSKSFALQCVAFLKRGTASEHRQLYSEILSRDRLNLYSAVLEQQPSSKEYVHAHHDAQ